MSSSEAFRKVSSMLGVGAVIATALTPNAFGQNKQYAVGLYQTIYPDIGKPGSRGHDLNVPVYACIVDGIDRSGSVMKHRLDLQRDALVHSLESDDFGRALSLIPHKRIGLHLAFFGTTVKMAIDSEWIVVDNVTRFELAKKIRAWDLLPTGYEYTNTNTFMRYAIQKLQYCQGTDEKGRPSGVNAIDIMTDGTPNRPGSRCVNYHVCAEEIPSTIQHRNEAIARGITTNVLAMVIENSQHLPEWAKKYMVTPSPDQQMDEGLISPEQDPVRSGKLLVLHPYDDEDTSKWGATFNQLKKFKLLIEFTSNKVRNDFAKSQGVNIDSDEALTVIAGQLAPFRYQNSYAQAGNLHP